MTYSKQRHTHCLFFISYIFHRCGRRGRLTSWNELVVCAQLLSMLVLLWLFLRLIVWLKKDAFLACFNLFYTYYVHIVKCKRRRKLLHKTDIVKICIHKSSDKQLFSWFFGMHWHSDDLDSINGVYFTHSLCYCPIDLLNANLKEAQHHQTDHMMIFLLNL